MKSKKILQINTVCGVGSTGRIAKDLSIIMTENGIENYIAYGYGKSDMENSIKIGTKLDYYIHNILSRITGMQGRFSYFATKRFLKQVEKIKPDIIHLHNIHGNYINYGLLFKYIKDNNISVVWTLHDCWTYTGKCTHYDYIMCEKWKKQCKSCPQLKNYPKSYFFDFSSKEYIRKMNSFTKVKDLNIVTPSQWLSNEVKKSYLNKYPVHVINNGIDLKKFKNTSSDFRSKYNINNKFMVLGVTSNWGERKGIDTFIKLASILDKNYQIVMVGLSERQKELIPDNIVKVSRTNSIEELAKIYSSADVFINPTLEDNFPTTNLEALACGTPVITYKTGGSIETITEKCGIIVEKNNVSEMANAIKKLKTNNLKEEDCLEQSRKYDKNLCFNKYIELYEKILNGEKR